MKAAATSRQQQQQQKAQAMGSPRTISAHQQQFINTLQGNTQTAQQYPAYSPESQIANQGNSNNISVETLF